MTMHLQQGALQRLRKVRAKTLCHLVQIVRADGFVLRLTDLDRPITVDGFVYTTASIAAMSAARRDSGLRPTNQEVAGLIDGDTITIPDLMGGRYKGAHVWIQLVDWTKPWSGHAYRSTYHEIEDVAFQDNGLWKATLVGMGAKLARPVGGRFGGTWQTVCHYKLGDLATCRKNIAANILMAHPTSGTSSGGNTGLTLVDAGSGWTVDQWTAYRVLLTGGTGAWQIREIASNTSDTLTIKKPWDIANVLLPDNTTTYKIGLGPRVDAVIEQRQVIEFKVGDFPGSYVDDYFREGEIQWTTGANAGVISHVMYYVHATRRCTLFKPTPFDIAVNDRGIVLPGCDGLKTTCKTKFDNVPNFGGSDLEPGAETVLEPGESG